MEKGEKVSMKGKLLLLNVSLSWVWGLGKVVELETFDDFRFDYD